jgi:LysM repeat protein
MTKNEYHIDVTEEEDMLFRDPVAKPKSQNNTFKKTLFVVVGIHVVVAMIAIGNIKATATEQKTITSNSTVISPSPTPQLSDASTSNYTVARVEAYTTQAPIKEKSIEKSKIPKHITTKYTVKKGDTINSICKKFGLNYKKVLKINNIKDPNKIYPGQILNFL